MLAEFVASGSGWVVAVLVSLSLASELLVLAVLSVLVSALASEQEFSVLKIQMESRWLVLLVIVMDLVLLVVSLSLAFEQGFSRVELQVRSILTLVFVRAVSQALPFDHFVLPEA